MSIRLIFSDIDGTILPAFRDISGRTRAAIRACGEKGIPFVICSGRWFAGVKDVADSAGVGQEGGALAPTSRSNSEGFARRSCDAAESRGAADHYIVIANGGAVVRPDGTPVCERFMPEELARKAAEILKKYPTAIHAYGRNSVYRLNSRLPGEQLRNILDEHFKDRDGCFCITDDEAAFDRSLSAVYKIEAYIDAPGVLTAARPELEAAGLVVVSSHKDNLEILAPGMGKGAAVRWLTEHLGLRREETMAFGDNTNDLAMLEAVGWPVAVANAVDEVRAAAKIIAPSCEEDGVAQIIERILEEQP